MIEGSKNERAAILVAAYMIGFTTAYIAFGISNLGASLGHFAVVQPADSSQASVITSQTEKPGTTGASVAVNSDGLAVTIDGAAVVISATMPDPATGVLPEGYNTSIPDYAPSPSGLYVYFCEQPSTTVTSCRPYIYSVTDNVVHPLTQDGSRIAFATDMPAAVWTAGDVLSVDGMTSLSKPWEF